MRKKKYRKIYSLVNPLLHAIEGAAITDEDSLNKLREKELAAIEAFRTGTATVMDWKVVCEVCNLADSMGCSVPG